MFGDGPLASQRGLGMLAPTMTKPIEVALDSRAHEARDWAQSQLQLHDSEFSAASADASFRRYFRLSEGSRSWIVMDAPPEQEDCGPFIHVSELMQAAGLTVPTILARDLKRGFLLLDDLGQQLYLQALNTDNAEALMAAAVDALLQWQAATQPEQLPAYDEALLRRELALFPDWYVQQARGLQWNDAQWVVWNQAADLLVQDALAQPQVYVHRDYMPRNLMLTQPNPGILDFQDAVVGPYAYDLLCLYKDAFLSWPQSLIDAGVQRYAEGARRLQLAVPQSAEQIARDMDWIGVHRHLKVLGIFARLKHRDGKAKYLEDAPRFAAYLRPVLRRHDALRPLADLIDPLLPAA